MLILYTLFNIEYIVQQLTLCSKAALHSESDTVFGSHFVFNSLHLVYIVNLVQDIEHIVQHLALCSKAALHSESDTVFGSHFIFNILHLVDIVYLIQY